MLMDEVTKLIEEAKTNQANNSTPSSTDNDVSINSEPPKAKRVKKMPLDFLDNLTSRKSGTGVDGGEIEAYFSKSVIDKSESPLNFWEVNEKKFPSLAKLAQRYLAIPASSGSVERLFSLAGVISTARRASLSLPNVEKILVCRDNIVKCRKD